MPGHAVAVVCVCVCVLYTVAAGSHVHMSGVVSCSALVGIFFLLFVLSYAHSAHNTIIYIMSGFVLKSVRTGSTANYTHTQTHTGHQTSRKKTRHTNESSSFCPCAVYVLWQLWFGYLRYGRFGCCVAGFLPCFRFHFVFLTMHTNVSSRPPLVLVIFEWAKRKSGFCWAAHQVCFASGQRWNNEWARKRERRVECVFYTEMWS